ncbi:DNA-binding protein WhiA [Pseudonocardia sp. ICBG162]|uniref:DNA-binding protein WhiA n=1 Tax=Pseudonocardia sp. ICBG162 TaxID=2846761 RepID=UPI001CF69374
MTKELCHELGAIRERCSVVRWASVVTQLRLAGEVSVRNGESLLRAEFRALDTAIRWRDDVTRFFSESRLWSDVTAVRGSVDRYSVQIRSRGVDLARGTGLLDRLTHPISSLPTRLLTAGPVGAAGVWRGALLASGDLGKLAGRIRLGVVCPSTATAMALVGTARDLGALATSQETIRMHRVVVRDPDSVNSLLLGVGAFRTAEKLSHYEATSWVRVAARQNLTALNARRVAEASDRATPRAHWALETLGKQVPDNLYEAGALRMKHPSLPLSELSRLATPPLTKDALAGRLRRLIQLAEKQHREFKN